MNYKNRDDELIRKQREAQALYSATNNNKKNQSGYSLTALQKLASGNYRKVPELQPTKAQPTTQQNQSTQQKPSTRYNQNVSTQEKKSTRDTRYDKDFDNYYNYREGDFSGEVDYDPKTDTDIEKWRNVKKDIMKKNNWTDEEFDKRYKAYSKERYQKMGDEIIASSVETAKKHPILGTIQQATLNPGVWLEGAANMVSSLPFISDEHRAQSADDPMFLSSRQKEAIKQTVKDEHIKSDIGKGAYDIGTSIGDMVLASGLPVLGTAALGAETASRTQRQALERGVDPTKASRTGAISGVASALMNKIGFDKAVNTQAKTALGSVLQGMGIEGAENVAEDTFNLLVDTLMNKDKSQLSSLHDYYVSQGMSDKEATAKATTDTLKDLALSGISGAAFGGVMRGVRNLPELASDVKALGKYASMDNRGSVDPKALAEEARLNVKAPAKVVTPLEGAELENAQARIKELKTTIAGKKTEVQSNYDAWQNASKKNKNAAYQKYQTSKAELDALQDENRELKLNVKGGIRKTKDMIAKQDADLYNELYARYDGVMDNINYAVKFAGDSPEAKELGKTIKKTLEDFIETGDAFNTVLARENIDNISKLDTLAKDVNKRYANSTFEELFGDYNEDTNTFDMPSIWNRLYANDRIERINKFHQGLAEQGKPTGDSAPVQSSKELYPEEIAMKELENKYKNLQRYSETPVMVKKSEIPDDVLAQFIGENYDNQLESVKLGAELAKRGYNLWENGYNNNIMNDAWSPLQDAVAHHLANDNIPAATMAEAYDIVAQRGGTLDEAIRLAADMAGTKLVDPTNAEHIRIGDGQSAPVPRNIPEADLEKAVADSVASSIDPAHQLAERYAASYEEFDPYDYGDTTFQGDDGVEQMADDIRNGRDLSVYIEALEDFIEDAAEEDTRANMQGLIDELKTLNEGRIDGKLSPEEVTKLQDVADGKYDIPENGNEIPKVNANSNEAGNLPNNVKIPEYTMGEDVYFRGSDDDIVRAELEDQAIVDTFKNIIADPEFNALSFKNGNKEVFVSPSTNGDGLRMSYTIDGVPTGHHDYALDQIDDLARNLRNEAGNGGEDIKVQRKSDITKKPAKVPEVSNDNVPPRRSFFDDVLPRTDKTGISKVGTNTMVNSDVYTREQIDSDPIISEINKYAKANNDLTYNQAKEDIISDGNNLLNEYTSGKRSITTDLDVDRAMILLTDMANKIDAGDTSLEAQRNLLFGKLRQAGTLYGQTIQAFKKWNNTAEGAIANGEGILHEPVERWKTNNVKQKEINGRIAKALEQMGIDSSMRNKTTAEKTHEQVVQGVKNVLAKEYGSIDNYFNDDDIEVLANWAENKVPVWQITDEIEHKLSTGEWYTLDESTQPKYPINQKLKNALDDLVAQEPTVKEPPTLDEIRNEVRTTLDKEMARTGEFTDDDVNYIASLIQNGATKQELSEALNTKMATGKFGISPETQQQVTDLFTYANRFDPNSKQAFDLKTAAYKLIADEAVSEDATPFEKFESWRYLAMLGNPKTMVRNWVGNKMFGAVTGVSNNLSAALEAGVDKASKAMGGNGIQRTKAFLNPVDDRALIKAAGEDGEAHRYTTLNGTKYEKGIKDAIKQQKSVFNSKLLRLYEAATDRGVSDYSAVKKKYSTSLAGYMKANGLDESAFDANDRYTALKDKARTQLLTDAEKAEMNSLKSTVDLLEKARDYAVKQAEYATFHEDNAFAKWLTKASNSAPGPLKAVIEGLVPFKKTPANILRSGTEYSPLGFLNSIWHTGKLVWENTGSRKGNLDDTYIKKSKLTGKTKEVNKALAADVLDSWSKTLTGSALVGLGYYLKNKGIINSSNKDEKWQDDLEGIQNYSITINGKTYTLDWAAPAVMPLLMGAEISKVKERNGMLDRDVYENLDEIIGTANALLDPIFETSMLQGIKNTFESAANDIKYDENGALGGILGSMAFNTGLGYLTQGIPTLSGQIARTVDNTRRSTDTATDQSFMGSVEKQGRKLMNKIPGLSMLNNPYYDSYGRTQNNSPWNDPIRNFLYQSLSPAYIRDINTTPADEAARNAYYGLGEPNDEGKQLPMMDSKVFPSWKSKVTANGEKLSPDEMATYRKESGEAQYAIRDALAKEDWFNNLEAPKQAEILKKVNTLVDKIGKDSVDKLDSGSKDFEAYQSGGVEGLLNKWSGEEGANKAKEITGLGGNTNAIKEINAAYAEGDTKKGDELTEKYAKYNKERERINEKYGVNIKMADFTEREDANPGSNEQWAKEHSNGTTTTTKTTSKTTVPKVTTKSSTGTAVDTAGYEKYISRAGRQSTKFTNDLPKLKELNYGKSEMYTYAYAINQDSSLTPQSFNTQFKKMDLDNGGSMSQDEMIDYFNRNNTSEQQANYLWRTYGENKGKPWKAVPVLNDGTWKKKKK